MSSSKKSTPELEMQLPQKSDKGNAISDEVARALAEARRDDEFRRRNPSRWAAIVRANTPRIH